MKQDQIQKTNGEFLDKCSIRSFTKNGIIMVYKLEKIDGHFTGLLIASSPDDEYHEDVYQLSDDKTDWEPLPIPSGMPIQPGQRNELTEVSASAWENDNFVKWAKSAINLIKDEI